MVPGDLPQPGLSGVAKPLTVPGVEVVDVSRPELPVLSQTYVPASGVGGTHTARSHVIPAGPENGSRAPGEYVFSVANGIGIEISKLNSLPGGDKLTPVHTIELEEAHDTFVQNDPITDRTYLYIAAGFSTGFLVYDVTDPADPVKLADWDLTPECGEDWYSHTIDVAVRNGSRYLTLPVELIDLDLFGDQSEEDQAAGCGQRVGNGEQAGPLWIVDVTDFTALGQEGDSDDVLRSKSQAKLVATWVNPEGQVGRNLLFSPHNQQIVGDKIYLSAYHAGIYVLDASAAFAGKNERPSELGFVVPSGEPTRPFVDQEAGPLIPFVSTFAFVRPNIWDMYVYKGYILTGDMTGGFYSFQYEGDKPQGEPADAAPATDPATTNPATTNPATTTAPGGVTPAAGDPACRPANGFRSVSARPLGERVALGFARRVARPVDVDVFQVSSGRRVLRERLVARYKNRTKGFVWNGRSNQAGRRVTDGYYFVRYRMELSGQRVDTRRKALSRVDGRFAGKPSFYRRTTCGLLRSHKLTRPVFGGRRERDLRVSYLLTRAARVTITVRRGGKVVRRFKPVDRPGAKTFFRVLLDAEKFPRGSYKVKVVAQSGTTTQTSTLTARRI